MPPPSFSTAKPCGVALVIVLSILVLITVLVITFFSGVTTDFAAARSYSNGENTKQLADSAVNLVMAQIKDATAGFATDASTGVADVSRRLAWASQPGMLRTWDDSGNGVKVYKLYSSEQMVQPASDFSAAADQTDMVNGKWKALPALYTDLNSPVLIRDDINGTITPDSARPSEKYIASAPIISPNGLVNGASLPSPVSGYTYDSDGDGKQDIQGFSVTPPASYDQSKPLSEINNPVPMPVKWLYVLRDGKLASPTLSGSAASFSTTGQQAAPTAQNPIVGRIAFWADDETCKVNVNTASEGTPWSVPVCASVDEMPLAANPPVQNEFQRVPGHPAMTCLSPIFSGLPIDPTSASSFVTNLQKIYSFTPRISQDPAVAGKTGGSLGGTYPITDYNHTYAYSPSVAQLQAMNLPSKIKTDGDRLFADVDDILFKPDQTLQDATVVTPTTLKQERFFLTANSRAPEVSLYNTPRISLWPITWPYPSAHLVARGAAPAAGDPSQPLTSDPWMAAQEQLLAFCGTLNNQRYFFQRQNPDSPVYDYYNILRNQTLLKTFLRAETDKPIPGFGGSFGTKYGAAGRDSLLVKCFDMIRGSVNLSTITDYDRNGNVVAPSYDYAGVNFRRNSSLGTFKSLTDIPSSQVVPMKIDLGAGVQKGFGQFPTIGEAAMIFYATARNDPYPTGPNPRVFDPSKIIDATHSQTTQMKMVLLLSEFLPAGNTSNLPAYWVKATGSPLSVNGASIGFPAAKGNVTQMKFANNLFAPTLATRMFIDSGNAKYFEVGPANGHSADQRYEFVSDPITVDPASTSFTFSGSTVTFDIYAPDPANLSNDPTMDATKKVQSIQIDFSKLNGTAMTPLAPRWTVNQIIPKEATSDNVPQLVTPPVPFTKIAAVPADLTKDVYLAGNAPHREISRNGYYLYQDEGFRTNEFPEGPFNSKSLLSPIWDYRMVCACDKNYKKIPGNTGYRTNYYPASGQNALPTIIGPYDTVLSMAIDPVGVAKGDGRVVAGMSTSTSAYAPAWTTVSANNGGNGYSSTGYPRTTDGWQRLSIGRYGTSSNHLGVGAPYSSPNNITLLSVPMATSGAPTGASLQSAGQLGNNSSDVSPTAFGRTALMNASSPLGDWINSPGDQSDGCLLWYPDQDFQSLGQDDPSQTTSTYACWLPYFYIPYASKGDVTEVQGYFSPNRQVASPVLFGTLPSPALGSSSGDPMPWQTLVFSPNPAIGASHPGLIAPKDHLLLDLFWMPVVEPYAISEAFSTAGKVNLNYQIAPFNYINRQTGLYAVMKSAKIIAIPTSAAASYKSAWNMRSSGVSTRLNIDVAKTLAQFDTKFANNDLFRSASQICEEFLVPQGQTLANVSDLSSGGYWNGSQTITGDNSREEPYNQIYPRITTKSNTFRVHYRVQLLKKRTSSDQTLWEEGKDLVLSEYRGSSLLERYIDPNDTRLPDFAALPLDSADAVLDKYYRFRVISTKAFTP